MRCCPSRGIRRSDLDQRLARRISIRFVLLAQFRDWCLEEAGHLEHRGVFLVPANIAAAIARPRLVYRAAPVFAQELAGREPALDALAAFAGALDDVALLERRDRQPQMLRQPANIIAADLHVT